MTVITKNIGRLSLLIGEYDSTRSYGKRNRVTLFGSEFESKHDNNNTAPATWDGNDTVTFNEVDWLVVSNGTDAWLAGQDKSYQPENFSGMGRVVLMKHLVEVEEEVEGETVTVTKNLLYQDDFYKEDPDNPGQRIPNTNTVFVVKYDFTLGEDITVPENCILEFDGGSINAKDQSRLVLSDNCVINGNGAVCHAHYTYDATNVFFNHYTLIEASNVSNISISNLTIVGGYTEDTGVVNPRKSLDAGDGYALLYIDNVDTVCLVNLGIESFVNTCGFGNGMAHSWNQIFNSNLCFGPVKIIKSNKVNIDKCKFTKSCGEAWTIAFCDNVCITESLWSSYNQISFLHCAYCDNVRILNSTFKQVISNYVFDSTGTIDYYNDNNTYGDCVNVVARHFVFANNLIVNGGYIDYGNEVANVSLTLPDGSNGTEYVIESIDIHDNILINSSFADHSENISQNLDYNIKNLSIRNNYIEPVCYYRPDISEAGVYYLSAVWFGSHGATMNANIVNNNIKITFASSPSIKEKIRYGIINTHDKYIDCLLVENNSLSDEINSQSDVGQNAPNGLIVFKNIGNVKVIKNIINAPLFFNNNSEGLDGYSCLSLTLDGNVYSGIYPVALKINTCNVLRLIRNSFKSTRNPDFYFITLNNIGELMLNDNIYNGTIGRIGESVEGTGIIGTLVNNEMMETHIISITTISHKYGLVYTLQTN